MGVLPVRAAVEVLDGDSDTHCDVSIMLRRVIEETRIDVPSFLRPALLDHVCRSAVRPRLKKPLSRPVVHSPAAAIHAARTAAAGGETSLSESTSLSCGPQRLVVQSAFVDCAHGCVGQTVGIAVGTPRFEQTEISLHSPMPPEPHRRTVRSAAGYETELRARARGA